MTAIRDNLNPETAALWQTVAATLAAPGMSNPDEAARKDTRTPGQRNHDAFTALLRAILASGDLGSHKGLPATLVITTTLKELQAATGHAVTGGGTLLPMREVIKQAATAHHYLRVFDDHTQEPLYLGRAKRLATPAQRLALYARDRGCTFPGCTAPAAWCEAHHDDGWAKGHALTDITTMSLACPADNDKVEKTGWRTRKRPDGRTEWLPPPNLDTGQTRINNYHHPHRYLIQDQHDSRNNSDDDGESD